MSRIDKIAKAKSKKKSRFWLSRLDQAAQKELHEVRANFHLGRPNTSASEFSRLVVENFPEIDVKAPEVCEWLKQKE